jgi:hypothetical protein
MKSWSINSISVALQSIKAWVSMMLSCIFSEHFTTRYLLSIDDSFISALQIENYEIPKPVLTDKIALFPVQLPSVLHWFKLFLTILPFPSLDPDFPFLDFP